MAGTPGFLSPEVMVLLMIVENSVSNWERAEELQQMGIWVAGAEREAAVDIWGCGIVFMNLITGTL